jgi:hypothetical protein
MGQQLFWGLLGFDIHRFIRLIADWSVANMNPDMTACKMSSDVSVSSKKRNDGIVSGLN